MKPNRRKLTLKQKSGITAHLYIMPFYLGFIFFFLTSIIKSVGYVFSKVTFDVTGVLTEYIGMDNFKYIFNKDLEFKGNLIKALTGLAWKTPVILIMSLLLAMIANRKSPLKSVVRSVFFLPVIISSGVVLDTIKLDGVASLMMQGSVVSATGEVVSNSALTDLLVEIGLNETMVKFFQNVSSNIFEVMFNCGIPMLIFISALQGIPSSLYEASSVEGATAWDDFWKITLPMITPTILINLVYVIVDSFASSDHPVMRQILASVELLRLGEASAMVWVFCSIIIVIFAALFAIFSRAKAFEAS